MPVKIISTDGCENKIRMREGLALENLVNDFCKGKEIISIQFEFNPAISVRHLAYITYKDDGEAAELRELQLRCRILLHTVSMNSTRLWEDRLEDKIDCITLEQLEDNLSAIEELVKGTQNDT